ncbi:phosphatase PAP2 family protein [Candidatus Bathyarchaeota archaeon]|nr:phosphatase PAP2 family protein [Candidatus Bathyarchaeota archaeon]
MPRNDTIAVETTSNKKEKKKQKHRWVLISYIILIGVTIALLIICPITGSSGRSIDFEITNFLYQIEEIKEFGEFFYDWKGQLPSYIYIAMGTVIVFVSGITLKVKRKKARKAGEEVIPTKLTNMFKYGLLVALVGLIFALGVTHLIFKGIDTCLGDWCFGYTIWGRVRSGKILEDPGLYYDILFTNWFQPARATEWFQQYIEGTLVINSTTYAPDKLQLAGTSDLNLASFYSGHTAQATLLILLGLSFKESRKKWLAPVITIASIGYIIIIIMGTMIEGSHWFSDCVMGAFVLVSGGLLVYYGVLFIPSQEMIYRNKRTYMPFNKAYGKIIAGKDLLQEDKEAGLQKIEAGLEEMRTLKDTVDEIAQYHAEYSDLGDRIDDISRRAGALVQELKSVSPSGEQLAAHAKKWSYFF